MMTPQEVITSLSNTVNRVNNVGAGEWSVSMWLVYGVVNWSIAAAFVLITINLRLSEQHPIEPAFLSWIVEAIFIASATHHFVQPLALYFLDGPLAFAVLAFIDTMAASVAGVAAYRLIQLNEK